MLTTTMKMYLFLLSFIFAQTGVAQLKVTNPGKSAIPGNIAYPGNFVQAARWTDDTGDNIVILSLSGIRKHQNSDGVDKSLYASHYLVTGDSSKQTWRVYDVVTDCMVDLFLDFVGNSFAVTDLDNNGKAEVWIMYKVSCQGDVSPVPMKIIMYQNNKKYALRGTTRVAVSENENTGGGYTLDSAFKNAPEVFRRYAENLWEKNKLENWNQ